MPECDHINCSAEVAGIVSWEAHGTTITTDRSYCPNHIEGARERWGEFIESVDLADGQA